MTGQVSPREVLTIAAEILDDAGNVWGGSTGHPVDVAAQLECIVRVVALTLGASQPDAPRPMNLTADAWWQSVYEARHADRAAAW